MDPLRYPIGRFVPVGLLSAEARMNGMDELLDITRHLKRLTEPLNPEQLLTPYREAGWSIQQVVHHMADNDMNAYIRFKRALTEDVPIASSYREDLWAELEDYRRAEVNDSITLLAILHKRFYVLVSSLSDEDFSRMLRTEVLGKITLDTALQRFIWHNKHHTAQIEALLHRRGWL
ncbi:metal-dependent hydrolase [Paenibacillus sp. FSL H7-0326]|uniref:YfiT family bacillithiol transferase n=1 Tax=Paenibacillus sp. FSL H7-0326 TaxID=1921144 RepID=UPI00096FA2ED|nr:putative metal-dependent hydrolase [Paenibacillus sp. FSL H7-0326]OMC71726.1 metal-dependent hydrolase [Paenibacillus sp. FSL H7-0326]